MKDDESEDEVTMRIPMTRTKMMNMTMKTMTTKMTKMMIVTTGIWKMITGRW